MNTTRIISIILGIAILAVGITTIDKTLTNPETSAEIKFKRELCFGSFSDVCADSN